MASAEEKLPRRPEEKSNDDDDAKSVDSFQKEATSLVCTNTIILQTFQVLIIFYNVCYV
jgi:hypothetical protein